MHVVADTFTFVYTKTRPLTHWKYFWNDAAKANQTWISFTWMSNLL